MKRRDMLVTSSSALLGLSPFLRAWGRSADAINRKVLMFTKSAGFEHSVVRRNGDQLAHAERILIQLGKAHNFEVTATKDGRVFDSDLSGYDAFLFYTTGDLTQPGRDKQPPMSENGKRRLLAAVSDGKGFIGSHCGSDTFHSAGHLAGGQRQRQTKVDPYIAMVGGEFISHGAQQRSRMRLVSPGFPGTSGLGQGFDMTEEWYSLKNFADDLHVILVQDNDGMKGEDYQRPSFPATWARRHGKGRVFYTSMGHREDVWADRDDGADAPRNIFHPLLLGGLAWAWGELEADVTPNIDRVTPDANVMPPPKPPRRRRPKGKA